MSTNLIATEEKKLLEELLQDSEIPIQLFEQILELERERLLAGKASCKGDIRELLTEYCEGEAK